MRPDGEERREFQRLSLNPPIGGTLASSPVSIIEIGILGARVEHSGPLAADSGELRFATDGNEIALRAEVVRTLPGREEGKKQSGLRFVSAVGDSGDKLRDLLGQLVRREFAMRRRVPTLSMPAERVDGDKTVRGKDAMFFCFRLESGLWRKRRVFLPEQPSVGFTVATTVDGEELSRLCRVYEASDDEGRRLIRLFAELSVSDVLQIPPPA